MTSAPAQGWGSPGQATTLVLVRHGSTDHTLRKAFSGSGAGEGPPLNEVGHAQVAAVAELLASWEQPIAAVVSSPLRRTQQTAGPIATGLGLEVQTDDGLTEVGFGRWEGRTIAEVVAEDPDAVAAWRRDLRNAPPGGESFTSLRERVLAARDRRLERWPDQTVVVVSHVSPIKCLVADALGAPLEALFRMEMAPASLSIIDYRGAGHHSSLRLFNAQAGASPLG